jgi:cobalt-zinc-cadmium efflux system membrane fusion protein
MKTSFFKIILISSLALFTSGCSNQEDQTAPKETESTEKEVKTQQTAPKKMGQSSTFSGIVTVPPSQRISIHTPIAGYINAVNVMPGGEVKKGQLLARIEHRDIIMLQENFVRAYASFNVLKENYKRQKELHTQNVLSDKEFQQTESDYLIAEASKNSYEAQLGLVGIQATSILKSGIQKSVAIRAPKNGALGEIAVNEGMFVQEDMPLFEIFDATAKYVQFEVFASDISKFKKGMTIYLKQLGTDEVISSRVATITQVMHPEKQSVLITTESIQKHASFMIGGTVFVTLNNPLDQ